MNLDIYGDHGYINVADIMKIKNVFFYVLVGNRQIGKTYGFIKWFYNNFQETGEQFLYIRRTEKELEAVTKNPELSPFTDFNDDSDSNISFRSNGDNYTYDIIDDDSSDSPPLMGKAVSLGAVANIRGISGKRFKYILFDEFIPERHVRKIKAEGDALVNLYYTILGNRELRGEDPLKLIMLANSNSLDSPILECLNLVDRLEAMIRNNKEVSILPKNHLFMLYAINSPIAEQRKKDIAFNRLVDKESEVYQMANENKFSYNDRSDVQSQNLKNYKPLLRLIRNGNTFITVSINDNGQYYIHDTSQSAETEIVLNESGRLRVSNGYREYYRAFIKGKCIFSSYVIRRRFLTLYN